MRRPWVLSLVLLAMTIGPAPVASQSGGRFRIEPRTPAAEDPRSVYNAAQIAVLEVLNRADAAHLARLPALVIPEFWVDDLLAYSPFPPQYGWSDGDSKLLVVDQPSQAFAAYESGRLVRWGPVNTGRQATPTPSGLFHLNWRSPGRHSTVNSSWFMPWYYNFENRRGISFHEYALPGRPASHSCVRMLERDARWLYEWGDGWTLDDRGWEVLEQGTPVLILGCPAFDGTPPWRTPSFLDAGVRLPDAPPVAQAECDASRR